MKKLSQVLASTSLFFHSVHYACGIGYDSGPCLREAYELANNLASTTTPLGCTAADATPTLVSWTGPDFCTRGEIISINITSNLYFRNSVTDFASYTNIDGSADGE